MRRRTYGQREPVAAALDLVGDRWTLLILRELVLGPRRWTDLLANLGGIGKNLLAERLRDLEDAGFVMSSTLPWSSGRTRLYGLTDARGAGLERLVLDLARVGLGRMASAGDVRPEWAAMALAAATDPEEEGLTHVYIDGAPFTIRSGDGRVQVRRGEEGTPTRVVQGTAAALLSSARPA